MNLLKIIDMLDLSKVDQEEFLKPAMRRDLFKKAKDFSLKAALTSVPFALAAMPRIVKAQTSTITDTLNFALTLEYLESEFYTLGLAAANLIPSTDRTIFAEVSQHETAHVTFLQAALGNNAATKPTFDFTAGGAFADVFTNYQTFMALAQAFEDTGVRAYKGQAGNLKDDNATLTAALNIHSVEARHASMIRRLRGEKGWITGNSRGTLPVATQAIYNGEENVTHNNVDATTTTTVSTNALTEAFDEPLDKVAVEAIVRPFIV